MLSGPNNISEREPESAAAETFISAAAPKSRSIPSLDGLRAISISLVIASHVFGAQGVDASDMGSFGVRVFFIISGFLITGILLKELEAKGSIRLGRFYFRRTLRIFPAFYCFLLALYLLSRAGVVNLQHWDLPRAATYLTNYFPWDSQSVYVRHTWSLSNEEQFYLLWPFCLAFAGARRAAWIALGVILIEPVIRAAVLYSGPPLVLTIDRRFDCVADALATGCLLACISKKLSVNSRYLRFLASPLFALVVIVVFAAALTPPHPHIYYFLSNTILNIGIALCIDRSIRFYRDPFGRFLNSAPIRWIGVMSYSLYLWQQLFLSEASAAWNRFPLNIFFSIGAAAASFYCIEKPFQRLKDRASGGR